MKGLRITTTEFTTLKNSDFVANVQEKIQALIDNASTFSSPVPAINVLTGAQENLALKVAQAEDGSTDQKNARDLQRAVVTNFMYQLMVYILGVASTQGTTEGQIAVIEMAKFVPAKSASPVGPIPPVQGVKVKWTGNEGEVEVKFKAQYGAHSYLVQTTTADPASSTPNWQDAGIITRSRIIISGLQPLSKIWCRVIAYGASGASVPSDPAMSVVG